MRADEDQRDLSRKRDVLENGSDSQKPRNISANGRPWVCLTEAGDERTDQTGIHNSCRPDTNAFQIAFCPVDIRVGEQRTELEPSPGVI